MNDDKKKSFFSKVFGGKKPGCCNLTIEEIPESEQKSVEDKGCCCSSATGKPASSCCENAEPKEKASCCG